MVFKDQFYEIDGSSSFIYAIVTFENNAIMMYRYSDMNGRMKGTWEKFREIEGLGKICATINYFYDEIGSKTYLFFGFWGIPMRIYNLRENSWNQKIIFPIDEKKYSFVSSINFIFMKSLIGRMDKKYVVYTHYDSNLINIADIDSGKIVQQLFIPNTHSISDLLVWNCSDYANIQQNQKKTSAIYLVVASRETNSLYGKGSLNILSLEENMSFVLKKSLRNDISPVNLMKTKVGLEKNMVNTKKEFQEEKEVLVVISGYKSKSSIAIYKKK